MIQLAAGVLLLLLLSVLASAREATYLKLPSELPEESSTGEGDDSAGTRWAVLIAGSNGYWNYRHQADVCHAYQILKQGGLKDENIVVFMYDDIAYNEENPRPGVIINSPHGSDVYKGVPKDYTGDAVNASNFYAVILGDRTAVKGGSGKVVDSGPNDHIFIYYTDHGGPGVLGMPSGPYLYANDLIDVLKKKHASGTYKRLVFYLEACESGSIFEGLLPEGLDIYATTASNAEESSWGTYCPGESPSPPEEYETCLGDLYSVAWMEDCDVHNLRTETLKQQYQLVKKRTANENSAFGSHVMQYGNLNISTDDLYIYLGTNPVNDNFTFVDVDSISLRKPTKAINQRDADLLHFWYKFQKAPEGSTRKFEAQKKFVEAMSHRMHVDSSIKMVGKLLFGMKKSHEVLNNVRPAGQPLADDWECLKSLVKTLESFCGSLSEYGMKHMRSIANMCNAGITKDQIAEAAAQACGNYPTNTWSSLHKGLVYDWI